VCTILKFTNICNFNEYPSAVNIISDLGYVLSVLSASINKHCFIMEMICSAPRLAKHAFTAVGSRGIQVAAMKSCCEGSQLFATLEFIISAPLVLVC